MRVGLCTKWIDEAYTGVGRYTLKVLESMMDLERAPEFQLIHKEEGADPVYQRAAKEHLYKPGMESLWFYSQDRFCKALSSSLDVLHEPFVGFRARMDCPQVLTFHDATPLMFPDLAPRAFALYFKFRMPKVVKLADAIICNSENTKKDLLEHFPTDPDKVHVTLLGVDPTEVDARGTFDKRKPYVLALSNTRTKNIEFTLREFERYKQKHGGDLRLIIVGKDYTGRATEVPDVELMNYLLWERLVELMSQAEALLFPSLYEGFGFPPVEAMSMGVPTIVSDRGSLPEVAGEASIVVDIDQEGSLASAIHQVTSDDTLAKELKRKGMARAKELTWERCAKQTLDVYEGLTKR
jgi:glycosyltransferase involved in cell wall biosynthesis